MSGCGSGPPTAPETTSSTRSSSKTTPSPTRVDLQHRLQQRPGPPALRRGPEKGGCTGWVEDLAGDGEALGRSRGGLTSKLHLAVDGRGRPMSILLTPGQAGDNPQLLPP